MTSPLPPSPSAVPVLDLAPVVPVVVVADAADAVPLARALVAGGLPAIEVTLRTPAGLDAIRAIAAEVADAVVGAGTVITPAQVSDSVAAGARFLVSPGWTDSLLAAMQASGVPFLPGVSTTSEVVALLERGVREMKFFPAQAAGGTAYLKSLAGPLPQARFLPDRAGIGPANAPEYLALPNVGCVGGPGCCPRTRSRRRTGPGSSGWHARRRACAAVQRRWDVSLGGGGSHCRPRSRPPRTATPRKAPSGTAPRGRPEREPDEGLDRRDVRDQQDRTAGWRQQRVPGGGDPPGDRREALATATGCGLRVGEPGVHVGGTSRALRRTSALPGTEVGLAQPFVPLPRAEAGCDGPGGLGSARGRGDHGLDGPRAASAAATSSAWRRPTSDRAGSSPPLPRPLERVSGVSPCAAARSGGGTQVGRGGGDIAGGARIGARTRRRPAPRAVGRRGDRDRRLVAAGPGGSCSVAPRASGSRGGPGASHRSPRLPRPSPRWRAGPRACFALARDPLVRDLPGREDGAARIASGRMSGCRIFHRPDICSTTSLESIRTCTLAAGSSSRAALSPASSPRYSATLLVAVR